MVRSSIPFRPEPVHLQKANLLALFDYALLHSHSHQWIGAILKILERKAVAHG
jgi:hypothetical protein